MHLSDITDAFINRKFPQKIVARGFDYFHNSAVENVVLRGDSLTAEVEGSDDEPYRVLIAFGASDIEEASCSCPYSDEWDGWCKHIAAVLVLCAHEPEKVEAATPLGDLLVALDRDDLEAVLLRLAKTEPEMVEKIAAEVERLFAAPEAEGNGEARERGRGLAKPDAASLRNAMRGLLCEPDGSQSLWVERAVAAKISGLFEKQVEARLNTGDTVGALLALEPLTEVFVDRWTNLAENDEIYALFPYLGGLWERTLTASLGAMPSAMHQSWKTKLMGWTKALDCGYDVGDTFAAAIGIL